MAVETRAGGGPCVADGSVHGPSLQHAELQRYVKLLAVFVLHHTLKAPNQLTHTGLAK